MEDKTIFKHPKTQNERKQYFVIFDQDNLIVKVRHKRKWKYIPSEWDDIFPCTQRNWKKHRKTQWKQ